MDEDYDLFGAAAMCSTTSNETDAEIQFFKDNRQYLR